MERYVSFVREWASDHGLTYMCSIGDPRLRADYAEFKKTGKKPKKSGRASKYQTKEEARRANIAKTAERKRMKKMIQMGAPERVVMESMGGEQKKYDIIKKILMELDRREGNYGNDTDPFGFVKDLLIIPEREGKTKKQIVDKAYDYFKTHTNINYDIRHSVLMNKLFLELQELMEASGMVEGEGLFDRGNQMPPSARDYLKKHGDQTITSMRIERIPLGGLQKNLTAIVYVRELLTKFKKPENIPQDDLFHLQVILTLSNGRRVMWGKEEVIKLSENIYKGDKMESRDLGKTNIKLQDFVDKTAKYMGAKFAPYNAFDNNCQDFIIASLKANGLGTQADYDFVKQDTKDLFKGRQWLVNMMKGATDLASAFNVFWEGKGSI